MRPVALLAGSLFVGLAVGGVMYLFTRAKPGPTPALPRQPMPVVRPAPKPQLQTDTRAPRGLEAVEARLVKKPQRRQLAALALLYASEGREHDLLRMLHAALDAGADPDRVLDAIRELRLERQGAALAQVLKRHPDVDFDPDRAARIFEQSGDPARALAVLREALPEQDGFDPDLVRRLLRLDPAGGASFLFGLDGADEWRGEDLQALVGFLAESGQPNEALAFVNRALDAHPEDRETLRVLARIEPQAAIERLRGLVADHPDDVSAWMHLGYLLRKQGQGGGAFEALERAAALKPSRRVYEEMMKVDPERALPMIVAWTKDETDDEAIGLLARAHMKAGQREQATAVFLRAHKSDPDDSEWIRGLIRLDPAQAVSALEARIAKAPAAADEDLVGQYADALRAAGRTRESFDQYLAAHRKDPGDSDWQAAMAKLDPERALPVLEAFLQEDPGDASGRGAYGVALAALGRTDDAAKQLESAIARGHAETWYEELAKIDGERALSALQRRARRARDDEAWGTLGRALEKLGRAEEARRAFRRALALDPTDADWAAALRR